MRFAAYVTSRGFSELAYQMAAVAVGWHIYSLTHSALYLGLAGLTQFGPTLLFVFGAGHVADRYDRARITMLCQFVAGVTAGWLAWGSYSGWLTVSQLFLAVAVFGSATAFEGPAAAALLPALVPAEQLPKGTAVSTAAFQVANVAGPAIAGLVAAVAFGVPYALMAAFWIIGGLLMLGVRVPARTAADRVGEVSDSSLATLFAGFIFVRRNPAILGAISLDLCAVLLGGATALMPIYASDILHTGPWGLGVLRAAPSVGALLMSAYLARHELTRRVGRRLFHALTVYGLTTVIFAISRSIWLSLLALVIMGAADTVSMVIRISLVQLATPDEMRGRVGAVNFLFVNASGQIGEFESGLTAALLGVMPAAVIGGLGTIAVTFLWMKLFPVLRDMETLGPAVHSAE